MRRSIKKVAAGLLATMMIGTMLTGCGGGNKKDSGSSKKESKIRKTSRSLLLRQENLHRQKVRKLWNLS